MTLAANSDVPFNAGPGQYLQIRARKQSRISRQGAHRKISHQHRGAGHIGWSAVFDSPMHRA